MPHALTIPQVAELTELLQDRLGVAAPAFGGFAAGAPAAPGAAPGGAPAAAAPAAEEKTEFTVKLDGFADGEKLKVKNEESEEREGGVNPRRGCALVFSYLIISHPSYRSSRRSGPRPSWG